VLDWLAGWLRSMIGRRLLIFLGTRYVWEMGGKGSF